MRAGFSVESEDVMCQSSTDISSWKEQPILNRDAIAQVDPLVSFQDESKVKLESPWLGCGCFFMLFFGGLFCPGLCKQALAIQNSVSSVSTITKTAPLPSSSDTIVLYQRSNRLPLQETAHLTRKLKPKKLVSVRSFASGAHPVLGPKTRHNLVGGSRFDKRLRSRRVRDEKHFLPHNSLPQDEHLPSHREEGCNPYPPGTINHAVFNDTAILCSYHILICRSKLQNLIDKKDKPFLKLLAGFSVEVRAGLLKFVKRSGMDEELIGLQCEDTKKSIEHKDTDIARMCADEQRAQAGEQRANESHEIDKKIKVESHEIDKKIKVELHEVAIAAAKAEEDRKKAEEDRKNRLFAEQLRGETLKNQILEEQLEELKKNKKD